jgi:DNA repair protein RadA
MKISTTLLDLTLETVDGIGSVTKKKLIESGISNPLDLAVSTPREVVEIIGGSVDRAFQFIFNAKKLLEESGVLDKEMVHASELLEKRRDMKRLTTGSKNLDELFFGGIETQAITEFYGEYGSGKSQICHTLCVNAQLPAEKGGLEGKAIYIDTEGTFRPERIYQIAEIKGFDANEIVNNVIVCKVYNTSHLELVIRNLGKYLDKYGAKLVIVDSIISHFRAEFIGRGTLAERQQRLNALMRRLLRLTEVYNIAVVVTNQVQSKPDTFFGDPIKPAGGNILAHICTYRIYLRKGKNRRAIIVDSPLHPYSEARFQISDGGIIDPEDD